MTIQTPEGFIAEGKVYEVNAFPLDQLGDSWCTWPNPAFSDGPRIYRFIHSSTINYRRCLGTWLLEDNRLFLVHFSATDRDGNELGMQEVFGTESLFAFWFSGEITDATSDKERRYDRVCEFVHGRLTRCYRRDNESKRRKAERRERLRAFIDKL